MNEWNIRRAQEADIPAINKLLYQVHKVHSDVRPDLFKVGAKKYDDDELRAMLGDDRRPIFVVDQNGTILGYAFCIHQQYADHSSMTGVKTLYIDDLCVEETARGGHIGSALYGYVLDYAKKCGYYNVTLNVWADNRGALKFYEKLGLRAQKIGMEQIL